jgi:hypothetical protein
VKQKLELREAEKKPTVRRRTIHVLIFFAALAVLLTIAFIWVNQYAGK